MVDPMAQQFPAANRFQLWLPGSFLSRRPSLAARHAPCQGASEFSEQQNPKRSNVPQLDLLLTKLRISLETYHVYLLQKLLMIHNNYKYWDFLSRLSETGPAPVSGVCRLRATLLLQLLKRLLCAFLSRVWVTDIWWPGIFSKTAFWKQSILGPFFLDIRPNQKMLASLISASIYKGAFKRCSAARLSFSSWSCAFGMHTSGCLTWLQAGPNTKISVCFLMEETTCPLWIISTSICSAEHGRMGHPKMICQANKHC